MPNFEDDFDETKVMIDLHDKQDLEFMKNFHEAVKAYQILS